MEAGSTVAACGNEDSSWTEKEKKRKRALSHVFGSLIVFLASWGGRAALAEEGLESGMAHDWTSNMHFHGYADFHYNNPKTGTMDDGDDVQTDFHRFVLGWGYRWSDSVRFDAEIDYEHNADEIELEYAMLEIDVAPSVSIRAGSLLMPIGPMNEFHEPPLYYSVERPYLQVSIIPTSWMENGVGLAGRGLEGRLAYRAYLVTGLDANGFTTMNGLRGGRSKGVKSTANDLAFAGRLEYRAMTTGLTLGGSAYLGKTGQNDPSLGDVDVSLLELDARYRSGRIDLKGALVWISIDGADAVSTAVGETVGSAMQGWNVEAGLHLLTKTAPTDPGLVLFVRREQFDTNHEVPTGFARDLAAKRDIWTAGLAYYPDDRVVVKADAELWEDGTGNTVTRFNLGFGFMF